MKALNAWPSYISLAIKGIDLMPASKKYNQAYHDAWGWSLAAKGATDKEIADAFAVTEKTINRWKFTGGLEENGEKELSSFGKALEIGKQAADAIVEQSLYKKCVGYEFTEEESIVENDGKGGVKPIRIRKTKRVVPPDTMAIMYWLNNRCRKTGEWSNQREERVTVAEADYSVLDAIAKKLESRAKDEQGNGE